MKRLLSFSVLCVAIFLTAFTFANAQGASPWFITGAGNHFIKPVTNQLGLQVPGLATSTTGCLAVNSTGWISASGSACGTGGGASFPFTPLAGYNATSTVIGFLGGLFSTASSTFSSSLFVTALSAGDIGVKSTGQLYSHASTTFSGGLTYSAGNVTADLGTSIAPTELASSDFGDFTCNGTTCSLDTAYATQATTLTVAGTANQLTSSAGAQSLAANRTWTLSLPNHVIFPGNFQATSASTTNATSTNLDVTGLITFNSITGNSWDDFCTTITGGAGLCDGTDATGGSASWPFTPTSYGQSTTSVIGFFNGLFSNSSTTLAGTVSLSSTSDKTLSTDVNGQVYGTATSTPTISTGLAYSGTFGNVLGGSSGSLTCVTGDKTTLGCLSASNFNIFNNKIGTSSVLTNGQLLVAGPNGNSAYSIATTTTSCSSGIACTSFTALGAASTITFSAPAATPLSIPYASTTMLTATTASTTSLIVSGLNAANCDVKSSTNGILSCGSDVGAFPFTSTTNYGALTNATGTPVWFQAGLQASSTSYFVNATTSQLTVGDQASSKLTIDSTVGLPINMWLGAPYDNGTSLIISTSSTNQMDPTGITHTRLSFATSGVPYVEFEGYNPGGYGWDLYGGSGGSAYLGLYGNTHSIFLDTDSNSVIDTGGSFKLKTGAGSKYAFLDASGISSSDKTFTFPNLTGTLLVGSTTLADTSIGIGSTTPWGRVSIAAIDWSDYTRPIFTISTSSDPFGFIAGVWATSTTLVSAQNPRGYVLDSGVRFGIGTQKTYDFLGLLDQLTVNGRISTGDWVSEECNGILNGTGSIIADTSAVCREWAFQVDTAGSAAPPSSAASSGGLSTIKLCPTVLNTGLCTSVASASGQGSGLFYPQTTNGFFQFATTTPVFEAVFRRNTLSSVVATSTSHFLGFVNTSPGGTAFETEPTAGCYVTASSTSGANWKATCRTTAAAVTIVDTGIASTSRQAGAGQFIRLRIEADNVGARFYMATSGKALAQVANVTTNVPKDNTFSLFAAAIIANTADNTPGPSLEINRLKVWYQQPALNY
jgi:hypothetical protein